MKYRTLWIVPAMMCLTAGDAFGQAPPQIPGVKVDVVSPTPLSGVDLPREVIAAPVQSIAEEDIDGSGALDLSDFMNRRLANVHINEIQGNPFQVDINYRGYTASPLLGTPQGLSVYLDGVRLNQPFGEVVSWDLIPRNAISSATLMPGSNPLFGLNTLGGALAVQTKNGKTHSGGSAQLLYGSHARRALEFEYGGSNDRGWNWFLAGNRFGENGWREDSHTDVRQLFGKFGRQTATSDVSLTVGLANNSLNGNALQEQRLLDQDYSSIYTRPDNTHNRSALFILEGRRTLNAKTMLSGNVYYRGIRTNTFNADINDESLDQAIYQPNSAEQAALASAGYTGFPLSGATAANTPFPFWRCLANVLLNDEPAEQCNGLINRSNSSQGNFGLSGQITRFSDFRGHRNQFTVGTAFDRSRVRFRQSTQLGYLNPDRSITGVPAYADGSTGGEIDGESYDTRVELHGVVRTWSVFATDTFSPGGNWHFTVSARYNNSKVHNSDQILPGGGPGSLDGDHVFDRLNPAAGLTYSPSENLNLYFGYSEGSRAPTSTELGCADPNQPCKLPNAMAGDPPLNQVVTRTWEAGIRSGRAGRVTWNAGYFRASNQNDILFVVSTQSGFGHFRNFGKTRRSGFEAGLNTTFLEKIRLGGGYSFLNATYATAETVQGSGNSSNDSGSGLEGTIDIRPGDRIPLAPHHTLKSFVNYQATRTLAFELNAVAVSTSLARGNENNLHEPDGLYYLGPGRTAGYSVVDAGARYQIHPRVELIAQLNNVFNKRYATAAQLGATGFTEAGNFIARPFPAIGGEFPLQQATFYAPGAPRLFWLATRFHF